MTIERKSADNIHGFAREETERERRDRRMAEAIAETGYERGDSRPPKFGERIMGIWAGERNPHRIGRYVETKRRTGRMNPGTWYRLTDGKGKFWEYEASQTLFVPAEQEAAN